MNTTNTTAGRMAQPPELPGLLYIAPLGSGGYSDVYLYEQQMPRMKVAVKVLAAHGLAEQARNQFSAEANAMAQLADHPHIVQVFRADISPDGRPFLVMKYYPQPNLAQRARGERFSVPDVLRIGIQVASAVEAAHRIGILHRDIKPANILTGQYGTLGLTDFGIAATKAQAAAGQTDGISIPWAAPEVLFSAERADERSDVYSIAATLWHLLVGRSPFDQRGGDNSAVALMHRITSSPAPPTGRGDVPPSFERLLHSALAKDPAARPATALAFARALQAVEQEQRLALTTIIVADDPRRTASTQRPPGAPTGDDGTRVRQPVRIEGADHREPSPAHPELDDDPTRRKQPTRIDAQAPMLPPWRPAQPFSGHGYPPSDTAPVSGPRPTHGAIARPARPCLAQLVPRRRRCMRCSRRRADRRVQFGRARGIRRTRRRPCRRSRCRAGRRSRRPARRACPLTRVAAGRVRFRWAYSGRAAGDSYGWRTTGTSQSGVAERPVLVLPLKAGESVCLQVRVYRESGSFASSWSDPACIG